MGLDVVIAPYSIPIAHKAKIMDKINWISFIFNPPFFAFSLCMFHSFRNRATCQHFLRKKLSLFSTNICPQRRNNLKLILSDFHKKSSFFVTMYEKKSPAVFSLSGLSFLYEPRYPEAMPGPHYDSFVIITFIYWYGISIPSLSNVSLIASVIDHFAVQ